MCGSSSSVVAQATAARPPAPSSVWTTRPECPSRIAAAGSAPPRARAGNATRRRRARPPPVRRRSADTRPARSRRRPARRTARARSCCSRPELGRPAVDHHVDAVAVRPCEQRPAARRDGQIEARLAVPRVHRSPGGRLGDRQLCGDDRRPAADRARDAQVLADDRRSYLRKTIVTAPAASIAGLDADHRRVGSDRLDRRPRARPVRPHHERHQRGFVDPRRHDPAAGRDRHRGSAVRLLGERDRRAERAARAADDHGGGLLPDDGRGAVRGGHDRRAPVEAVDLGRRAVPDTHLGRPVGTGGIDVPARRGAVAGRRVGRIGGDEDVSPGVGALRPSRAIRIGTRRTTHRKVARRRSIGAGHRPTCI